MSPPGAGLVVNDSGTGYSSFAYLRNLPADPLRIDRSFVERVASDEGTRAIVSAVVTMAQGLGMTVVAEGVETEAQLEAVMRIGCDVAQGYLLGAPLPAAEFAATHGALLRGTALR